MTDTDTPQGWAVKELTLNSKKVVGVVHRRLYDRIQVGDPGVPQEHALQAALAPTAQ